MGLAERVDWEHVHFHQGATILGGRWDGHVVEYHGSHVTYKGQRYLALRTQDGRVYYLLASMAEEWYSCG